MEIQNRQIYKRSEHFHICSWANHYNNTISFKFGQTTKRGIQKADDLKYLDELIQLLIEFKKEHEEINGIY